MGRTAHCDARDRPYPSAVDRVPRLTSTGKLSNCGQHTTADGGVQVENGSGTRADSATSAIGEGNTAVNTRTKFGTKRRTGLVLGLVFVVLGLLSTSAFAADVPIFSALTSLTSSPSDGSSASSDGSAAAGDAFASSLGTTATADPNRYIVTFNAGTSAADQAAALAAAGATDDSAIAVLRMHVVTLPDAAAASALESESSVARVEAD